MSKFISKAELRQFCNGVSGDVESNLSSFLHLGVGHDVEFIKHDNINTVRGAKEYWYDIMSLYKFVMIYQLKTSHHNKNKIRKRIAYSILKGLECGYPEVFKIKYNILLDIEIARSRREELKGNI